MSTVYIARKMRRAGDTGAGDENGEKNHSDEEIQKALEEIDSYQNEIDSLNLQSSKDILKIEQKYNELRNPFYAKRNEVISKIPHFWVTAFVNHPDLSTILGDSEEDCLHHLTKLEVEEFEDIKSGYKICFHFDENPYFENNILTKEFHLASIDNPTSNSTAISWKEGFDLMQTKPSPIKTTRKRAADQKTFFTWFNDHSDPVSDDIAEIIKDDLWLSPLQYFLVPDVTADNGVDDDDGSDQEDENDGDFLPIGYTDDEVSEIPLSSTDDAINA